MIKLNGIIKQINQEIESKFVEPAYDYRGRVVTKERVMDYFHGGYGRIMYILKYIAEIGEGKKILDIGIGYGILDIILKEVLGFDITGMEVPENVGPYCKLLDKYSIPVIPGKLSKEPCPIPDESFDIVILSEVIEHLRLSPLRALVEIKRILKPGGVLLLTTPNIARLNNILSLIKGRYILEPFPDDDTDLVHITDKMVHIREYTMNELTSLTERAGFKVIKSDFFYDPGWLPSKNRVLIWLTYRVVCQIKSSFKTHILILGKKI